MASSNVVRPTSGSGKRIIWTQSFVCLPGNTGKTPDQKTKDELSILFLGEKTLQFKYHANMQEVKEVILEAFPALNLAEGFTLAKPESGGVHKRLVTIRASDDNADAPAGNPGNPQEAEMYVIPDAAVLRQAKIKFVYIIPSSTIITEIAYGVEFSSTYLRDMLKDVYRKYPDIILDGENGQITESDYMQIATMEDLRRNIYSKWTLKSPITINRDTFLQDTFRIYSGGVNFLYQPDVKFISENGQDYSGLTREYFSLALTKLKEDTFINIPMFEGQENYKLPTNDITLYNMDIYSSIGKLMGHSAIHSNVGFVGLSQVLSEYILGKTETLPFNIGIAAEEVPDVDIKRLIDEGRNSAVADLPATYYSNVTEACTNANFVTRVTQANINAALHSLIYYHVYWKRKEQFQAIRSGFLSAFPNGFIGRRSHILLHGVFPRIEDLAITEDQFKSRIQYVGQYPNGEIKVAFDCFIKERGELDELNNVLIAWTGAPYLPTEMLTVEVSSGNEFMCRTCSKTITVPFKWTTDRVKNYLKLLVDYGSNGFGSV